MSKIRKNEWFIYKRGLLVFRISLAVFNWRYQHHCVWSSLQVVERWKLRRFGLVHNAPAEFENEGFTLKTHQMFFGHTMPEEFENATGHFGFVFEKNSVKENHMMIVTHRFRKVPFSKCLPSTRKRFQTASGLKSVLEKLRCRDGLVWTVGLTVK